MRHNDMRFKRKAYLQGYEPCLIAELEQEREWSPIYRCEMPVVALIGAAAAVSTGASMLAVGIAASSALTAIAGGLMLVGGVLSAVGVVTGNEKLQKVGGIMSLVGGVGGLAVGVTEAMSAGASFGEALSTSAGQMADAAKYGMGKVSSSVSEFFGGGESTVSGGMEAAGVDAGATANIAGPGASGIAPVDASMAETGLNSSGFVAPEMGAPTVAEVAPVTTNVGITPPAVTPPAPSPTQGGGFLSGAMNFAKENPMLTYGAMQGLGSAFSPDPIDPNKAQMEIYNQKSANANDYVVVINPNSPNAEKDYQAAVAAGKKVVVAGYQAPQQPKPQPVAQQPKTGFLAQPQQTRIA